APKGQPYLALDAVMHLSFQKRTGASWLSKGKNMSHSLFICKTVSYFCVTLFCTTVATSCAWALEEAVAIQRSKQYFAEAKTTSDADGGKLWGKPLYGPMVFLDTETRTIYANQPDAENRLREKDSVYIAKVGPEFPAANTAHRFGGVYWTVIP